LDGDSYHASTAGSIAFITRHRVVDRRRPQVDPARHRHRVVEPAVAQEQHRFEGAYAVVADHRHGAVGAQQLLGAVGQLVEGEVLGAGHA
jgi:hypothetical protein